MQYCESQGNPTQYSHIRLKRLNINCVAELLPPKELFAPHRLASTSLSPASHGHFPVGHLTAATFKAITFNRLQLENLKRNHE